MKKESLLNIYNREYAETYNEKFLTNPFSIHSADFELDTLKGLVREDTSWLDVGCGTGYFLSKFPGHQRAGMDISPDMLEAAKKVNPDALFFREADFRADVLEWHDKWSLISCMWYPYSYVESIGEVEKMIMNMIRWTKPGGEIFLPVADLEDFRPSIPLIPYEKNEEVYMGSIAITSYTWTWIENNEAQSRHISMVAPHIEHVIRLMEPWFETIEVVRYPPVHAGWVSRKAIIARNKRNNSEEAISPAKIIRRPIPAPAIADPVIPVPEPGVDVQQIARASHQQLLGELFKRLINGQTLKALFRNLSK